MHGDRGFLDPAGEWRAEMNMDARIGSGKDEPIRIPTFVALLLISAVLWLFQRLTVVLRSTPMSLDVPRYSGYQGGRAESSSKFTWDRLNYLN